MLSVQSLESPGEFKWPSGVSESPMTICIILRVCAFNYIFKGSLWQNVLVTTDLRSWT